MSEYIGKRLAQLRNELACPGEDAWTQARVAQTVGLTQNMVSRLESEGKGSMEALMSLLLFYYQHGYNLNWVLAEDNSTLSKMVLSDASKVLDAHMVFEKIEELRHDVGHTLDKLVGCLSS